MAARELWHLMMTAGHVIVDIRRPRLVCGPLPDKFLGCRHKQGPFLQLCLLDRLYNVAFKHHSASQNTLATLAQQLSFATSPDPPHASHSFFCQHLQAPPLLIVDFRSHS